MNEVEYFVRVSATIKTENKGYQECINKYCGLAYIDDSQCLSIESFTEKEARADLKYEENAFDKIKALKKMISIADSIIITSHDPFEEHAVYIDSIEFAIIKRTTEFILHNDPRIK